MPWGLQTHIYAPGSVDLRNKYQIKGNQPGEPRMPRELGDEGPTDGLYLQEDVEITCSFAIAGYVKKNVQKASAVLIARMLKEAELLHAGELYAMIENGKLKTFNPALQEQLAPLGEVQLPSPMALPPNEMPPSALMNSARDLNYPQPLRISKQPDHQDCYVAPKSFAAEMP